MRTGASPQNHVQAQTHPAESGRSAATKILQIAEPALLLIKSVELKVAYALKQQMMSPPAINPLASLTKSFGSALRADNLMHSAIQLPYVARKGSRSCHLKLKPY
jgi:hypothetical protein